MPSGRDNNVGYAGHKPTKHVFVFTLPVNEEPEVYEDEVVLRLQNMPGGIEEVRMTPGCFNSFCNAVSAAHTQVQALQAPPAAKVPQPDGPATFTAELGEVSEPEMELRQVATGSDPDRWEMRPKKPEHLPDV